MSTLVLIAAGTGCVESPSVAPAATAEESPPAGPGVAEQTSGSAITSPGTVAAAVQEAQTPPAGPTTSRAARATLLVDVDPPLLDFGLVPPNTEASGTVRIRNNGSEPVTIQRIKPSCSCTTTNDLTGKDIPPGESVTLAAKLDRATFAMVKRESVTIYFEGHRNPLRFEVLADVGFPIRVVPSTFNLTQGEASGRLIVASRDKSPFTILSANGQPPNFIGFDPKSSPPRESYVLACVILQLLPLPIPVGPRD